MKKLKKNATLLRFIGVILIILGVGIVVPLEWSTLSMVLTFGLLMTIDWLTHWRISNSFDVFSEKQTHK